MPASNRKLLTKMFATINHTGDTHYKSGNRPITSVVDTGQTFFAGFIVTVVELWPVLLIPVVNYRKVAK